MVIDEGRTPASQLALAFLFVGGLCRIARSAGGTAGGSFSWRNESGPGHAGLGLIIGGLSRRRGDTDEMLAFGTLNLSAGKAFIALQMLFAVGALKFEFAHSVGPDSLG